MLRVIMVDDEPAARRGLRRLLSAHADVEIIAEAEDPPSALQAIREQSVDAIFLDVEMPFSSGFDLVQSLAPSTKVIFVTAHSQHAPRAFEIEALDYLLKPVRPERLAQAIERLRRACSISPEAEPPRYDTRDHLCLRSSGKTFMLRIDRIAALEADGDFTRFYIENEASLLIGHSLGKYEALLPQPPFTRVSRSFLLNLHLVQSLKTASRDEAQLQLRGVPEPFLLRRLAATRLRDVLKEAG